MEIYNCDICDNLTANPVNTDLGILCEDCQEEADFRAMEAYDSFRENI